jgi:hypothetical protein
LIGCRRSPHLTRCAAPVRPRCAIVRRQRMQP